MKIKIPILLIILKSITSFNLLDIYPNCEPENKIGLCQAFWAYSLSDSISITECIKTEINKKYSAQTLINNIFIKEKDNCKNYANFDFIIKALEYIKKFGIGSKIETPDISYFSGKKNNDYIERNFERKIKSYKKIEKSDNSEKIIKNFIYKKKISPIIILKNTVEANFDDLRNSGEDQTEDFISFSLIGWNEDKDGEYWIGNNSFNSSWSDSGFTEIPFGHDQIVGVFVFELGDEGIF